MDILKDRYTITELSASLNITDHALRYYEKEFKLSIPKDERGRRYYTTEMANIMYQIKAMRDQGLEIKAIRKILQSENIINEPPPVVIDDSSVSLATAPQQNEMVKDIRQFFSEFSEHITNSVSTEVSSAREYLSQELFKTKLELGACVENSVRKLEYKLEKHFQEVDLSIGAWREKNKKGIFRKITKNFK